MIRLRSAVINRQSINRGWTIQLGVGFSHRIREFTLIHLAERLIGDCATRSYKRKLKRDTRNMICGARARDDRFIRIALDRIDHWLPKRFGGIGKIRRFISQNLHVLRSYIGTGTVQLNRFMYYDLCHYLVKSAARVNAVLFHLIDVIYIEQIRPRSWRYRFCYF